MTDTQCAALCAAILASQPPFGAPITEPMGAEAAIYQARRLVQLANKERARDEERVKEELARIQQSRAEGIAPLVTDPNDRAAS
jgi:hypothetical protein